MDISTEISAIQAASRGSEVRQPIVDALNKINNGSLPAVSSSDSGKIMQVNASGEWELASKSGYIPITQADEGKVLSDGALVAQTSTTKTSNGTYDTTLNNEVVVNVSGGGGGGTLIEKSVNKNGVYNATDDSADGYSKVIVNVSGGSDAQVYDPIVNTDYVDSYVGKIVVSGCYATFDCYYHLASSPNNSRKILFTIPEAIRPYGFYMFEVGNGAQANYSYGKLGSDGNITVYTLTQYAHFQVRWFVPKERHSITYDSSIVSSVLDGGISINGNTAHLNCVLDVSSLTGGAWRNGILTIPSAYKPSYANRPFVRLFINNPISTEQGSGSMRDNERFTQYIRDSLYDESTGVIDIYIHVNYGHYVAVELTWMISQSS